MSTPVGQRFAEDLLDRAAEISLRDHFAGLVLNGIIAADENTSINSPDAVINGHAYLVKTCYRLADAMLAARKS